MQSPGRQCINQIGVSSAEATKHCVFAIIAMEVCDEILRHLYKRRKAASDNVGTSDVIKLAKLFGVTMNSMIMECGTLQQSELINWNRTASGGVRISKSGISYCEDVLDIGDP